MWKYILIIVFACDLYAFDILPEYQGLSERDLALVTRPSEINAEYQTVWSGYLLPLAWEWQWLDADQMFDLSIGSLSNTRFLDYSRAKVEVPLLENLKFRFTYFSERDRDLDQLRHVLELIQRINTWLELSVYGEPSAYKRENDIGFAILTSSKGIQNRFYMTSHDFTRADHNDQVDYFKGGRSPHSYGWTGELNATEGVRGNLGFRYDRPLTWVRPQEERIFSYSKKLAFANFEAHDWRVRLQWDVTHKAFDPDSATSAVTAESWQLERRMAQVGYGFDLGRVLVDPTFTFVSRHWRNLSSQRLEHQNVMPGMLVRLPGVAREGGFDQIQIGYEVNLFNRFGESSLSPPELPGSTIESRLQTAYEFNMRNKSRLMLALNFDMDQWTPVPTFEGGNGQFRTEF